jgi:demethylmenaquinone methyltransferase/2-methoxy-6-polyprenyl-1,4-benzoquinol methylase
MQMNCTRADRHQNPDYIRGMFASIADRYDLANHALSFGIDYFWRRLAARIVSAASPKRILDLATGSGDLALAIKAHCPDAEVTGADFCEPMLRHAQRKGVSPVVVADGTCLPFGDGGFDVVTVAFGLRNMASREIALREMARVLRPGVMVLVMDFSMPVLPVMLPAYRWYLRHVLPKFAGWLTGKPEAYEYLGESIEAFPRHDAMLKLLTGCGFVGPKQVMLSFGIASIYSANVPE